VRVDSKVSVPKSLPELPRLGLTLAMPAGFERLEYFGRGPRENYTDRNFGPADGDAGALARRTAAKV